MIALIFGMAFVGFVCLSMAMKRHYKQLFPNHNLDFVKVIIFRLIGTMLLIGGCLLSVKTDGLGIGLVSWFGLITFAALTQSMLLTYQNQFVLRSK